MEFIGVGIIILFVIFIGLLNLKTKNKKISKFFDKIINFLEKTVGHI